MPSDVATLIGNIELQLFKKAVEGWLNGYVQKGLITQQSAGEITAGAEDLLGLVTELYSESQKPPAA